MSSSTRLLKHITQTMPTLRKSEKKVADLVLHDPQSVIHASIAELAAQSSVSEPTVLRFCRAIGCDGYQDFKLKLAQNLGSENHDAQFELHSGDSSEDFKQKIFDSTISRLAKARDELDPAALKQAITTLASAARIEFYGFGASATVATDAQHKFFRLQVPTAAYSDPHMQSMSAATMTSKDVVIAISQTGRTRELLHSVQQVQQQGACVIGLCPADSPLAEACDLPLVIDIHEDIDLYTPLTSRIAHLVVVDILALGVAVARGPELSEHLDTVNKNLRSLRI